MSGLKAIKDSRRLDHNPETIEKRKEGEKREKGKGSAHLAGMEGKWWEKTKSRGFKVVGEKERADRWPLERRLHELENIP